MSLKDVREEIRKIDLQILDLIEKRTNLAEKILEIKKRENIPIEDKDQRERVIGRMRDLASEKGLYPDEVGKIYEILIVMNERRQFEALRSKILK